MTPSTPKISSTRTALTDTTRHRRVFGGLGFILGPTAFCFYQSDTRVTQIVLSSRVPAAAGKSSLGLQRIGSCACCECQTGAAGGEAVADPPREVLAVAQQRTSLFSHHLLYLSRENGGKTHVLRIIYRGRPRQTTQTEMMEHLTVPYKSATFLSNLKRSEAAPRGSRSAFANLLRCLSPATHLCVRTTCCMSLRGCVLRATYCFFVVSFEVLYNPTTHLGYDT